MSKVDIGVGDEFPLDESREPRGHHRGRHAHHHHGHRMHGHHGHHRHGGRGFGRLAFLLLGAGLIALIANHQVTAAMAFGLVGAGAALLILAFAVHAIRHWRHHRRAAQRVA